MLISLVGQSQSDCIMNPLEIELKNTDYIFVFEVDSLVFDSLDQEMRYITGSPKRSRVAIGRVMKIFKRPMKKAEICGPIVVQWDYIFEKKRRYFLFVNERNANVYTVKSCSYSAEVKDSKYFKKLYKKTCKYVKGHNYGQLLR